MMIMGDKKKALTAIMGPSHEEVEGDEPNALHAISAELVESVHAKDIQAVADCLRAAFDELDREPDGE